MDTKMIDPQLHILRSVARTLDPRKTQEAETARFNVFAKAQEGRVTEALEWLEALDVALNTTEYPLEEPTKSSVEKAISRIRLILKQAETRIGS